MQRPRRVQGAERVAGAQTGSLHDVVVRAAEEPVLPQRELVPGDELAAAGHAAETLDVVHLGAGAHHEVVLAEADAALGAFDPIQPARGPGPGRGEKHRERESLRADPGPAQDCQRPRPQGPGTLESVSGNGRTAMIRFLSLLSLPSLFSPFLYGPPRFRPHLLVQNTKSTSRKHTGCVLNPRAALATSCRVSLSVFRMDGVQGNSSSRWSHTLASAFPNFCC